MEPIKSMSVEQKPPLSFSGYPPFRRCLDAPPPPSKSFLSFLPMICYKEPQSMPFFVYEIINNLKIISICDR